MEYVSTRGQSDALGFCDAVETGLAPDRGLFLPAQLPDLSSEIRQWDAEELAYPELCRRFFTHFATDLAPDTLRRRVTDSYTKFNHDEIAPVVQLDGKLHVLELFHGPTLAFKDFALQLLGNLYEEQIARTGRPINVLGATSGDTGSAAIHGLLGKAGVRIFILYPYGRISPLQERQMTTTGAGNVFPVAIDGSFDDGQRIVKDLFGELDFKARYNLSAINSINLARILAQCVYYVWAWMRLPKETRDETEFVVPTGNFGNVLAGWLAHRMGLPCGGFRVAVNQNDILHRLFTTGIYEFGSVSPSHAPSMDIQVASNFERFLYYLTGQDAAEVRRIMQEMASAGTFRFEAFAAPQFSSSRTDDAGIVRMIQQAYQRYHYIADPHTACGFNLPQDGRPRCLLATAHPAKFPQVIENAIGIRPTSPSLEDLQDLPIVSYRLPGSTAAVRELIEEHGMENEEADEDDNGED
ncbi:MAG: threonine synthase [Opitutales bacterium]